MRVSPVALKLSQNNKTQNFNSKHKTIKDEDGKEYVKIPKSEYNTNKWIGGGLLVLIVCEGLAYLLETLSTPKINLLGDIEKQLKN